MAQRQLVGAGGRVAILTGLVLPTRYIRAPHRPNSWVHGEPETWTAALGPAERRCAGPSACLCVAAAAFFAGGLALALNRPISGLSETDLKQLTCDLRHRLDSKACVQPRAASAKLLLDGAALHLPVWRGILTACLYANTKLSCGDTSATSFALSHVTSQ